MSLIKRDQILGISDTKEGVQIDLSFGKYEVIIKADRKDKPPRIHDEHEPFEFNIIMGIDGKVWNKFEYKSYNGRGRFGRDDLEQVMMEFQYLFQDNK